jgi:hypothetical protein
MLAGVSSTLSLFAQNAPPGVDFDGTVLRDAATWSPDSGLWSIRSSSNPTQANGNPNVIQRVWGGTINGVRDVIVPGDYDGDGKTDIAVWRPSNGVWYVLRSSDGVEVDTVWGGVVSGVQQYIYAPSSRTLQGLSINNVSGTVQNPSNFLSGKPTRLLSNASYLTVDFGKEVGGIVTLQFSSNSAQNLQISSGRRELIREYRESVAKRLMGKGCVSFVSPN